MSDNKDINSKIDDLEAAKEKYMSENTVISIGGYAFTPAKLMIAFTLVSSTLGGLYGAFEVYKDYQSMKKAIAEYVTPDLSEINKKLEVLDKEMGATKETVIQATDYTNNIKNDLKSDIRRLEGVVDSVERGAKQSQRETDISVKEVRSELRALQKETDIALKEANANVDKKIQKALDNPLAK